MPLQPSRSDLHVNHLLTEISVAYIQSESDFIHNQVFPSVPVKRQSDRYAVYVKDYWFKTEAAKRAPATESVGTGYRIDNTPSYFCDVWAIHHDVPDDDRGNYDDPLGDPDNDATELVTRHMLLRKEKIFIQQYMSGGIWQGFQSGGAPVDFAPNVYGQGYWDSATSNPLMDVDLMKVAIKRTTGFIPNTLVLTENVFYALRNHPVVLDRIKYTQKGLVTRELLASLFEVDKVLVAGAVLNSAKEGQAANFNFMATNSFLLCYAAPNPGLKVPSAGYVFDWTGRFGNSGLGTRVKKFRMEHLDADRIEAEATFAFAQIGKDLGVYGTSVLQHP